MPRDRRIRTGDRVIHPKKPNWGLGRVLAVDGFKVKVFFVEAGEKTISLEYVSLQILDPPPKHPVLDGIGADAAGGRRSMSAYRSMSQCTEAFLERFPGGFRGARCHEHERDYKVEAHELAREALGQAVLQRLLAAGAFAEVCDRALQVVNKTNLIFPFEKMPLKDGLKPAAAKEAFAKALYELLHGGEDDLPARFDHFASVLDEMGAGKWTTATYFPFLLWPDRHQFVKPTNVRNAAAVCAFEIGYTPQPEWMAYERMLRFSDYLRSELQRRGLEPRDNIDVQTFMYAIAPE